MNVPLMGRDAVAGPMPPLGVATRLGERGHDVRRVLHLLADAIGG